MGNLNERAFLRVVLVVRCREAVTVQLATMGQAAECVMLNKGPYILEAVRSLSDILNRMTCQLNKSKYRYRPLNLAKSFFNNSGITDRIRDCKVSGKLLPFG